ncbi:MAG: M23 family metallopeptidase [bacterium]|nr:M23 family metallopeptidase [bacterium]
MKILLWLALPMVFLALYFAVPQSKNQPQTESESSVPAREEITTPPALKPVSLSVSPATIIQGEPALITIDGLASISAIQSLTLDDKPLAVFVDEGKLAALVGIDLHRTPGSYPIILTLHDGQMIEEKIEVGQRTMATEEFDIPEQLGGNTPQAEQELTSTLSQDTVILNSITATMSPEKLWNKRFRLPLVGSPAVTDVYGYSRQTGSVNLSHNGTDFRAPLGTPVYAMNSGKVVFANSFRNYGNTVIIDHGLGLMTMYMHLSEIDIKLNDSVKKGDPIAQSGNTGYSLGPHLHLSVRMGGFSIDPQKFLELMGSR